MEKRGQMGYFVAVGIVILMGAILLIYTNEKIETSPFEQLQGITEQVHVDVQPLQTFIDRCLSKVSKEAILRAGKQGGYISPKQFGYRPSHLGATEEDAIELGRDGLLLPYWYHLDSSNRCNGNCRFGTERPPLLNAGGSRSIERQIHEYILNNMGFCLNEYKPLREQGFDIFERGDPVLNMQIGKEDVRIKLTLPIQAFVEEREHKLNEFYVQHNVNLRRIYELAQTLSVAQAQYHYLERNTLNLISAFSGLDKKKLPPMQETSFSPTTGTYWFLGDVKKKLKGILGSYTPLFQVLNTKNFVNRRNTGDPYIAGHYGLFDLPVYSTQGYTFNDLSVQFRYFDWWEPYMRMGGRGVKGEYIGPEQGAMALFSFIGFKRYNNHYDLSYPVLVQIQDTSAFDGEGYLFQFPIEANIRKNQVLKQDYLDLGRMDTGPESLLCNRNQRNSGNVTIKVTDGSNPNVDVDEVQVRFACGSEVCIIGHTDDKGILQEQFPICAGGHVILNKQDFEQKQMELSTSLDKDAQMKLSLEPFREIPIKVFKRRYSKGSGGWYYDANPGQLLDGEVAVLRFERIEKGSSEPYETAVIVTSLNTTTARLLPGKYTVEGTLLMELPVYNINSVRIPPKTQTVGPFWDRQQVELPGIDFNETFVEGGIFFDKKTPLEFTKKDLDSSSQLNMFMIAPIASDSFNNLNQDDLERMDLVEELSKKHRLDLEPILTE